MNFNTKRILNILNPQPVIGGLEISNAALRFLVIKKDKMNSISIELASGIIEDGLLKDKEGFRKALLNFHSRITKRLGKKIYVIINIPSNYVYSQVFNTPAMAKENIEEAAKLNLQMISPIEFSKAYSDWHIVGENQIEGGQLEILGVFVQAQIVDEYIECFKEANFVVVAVEFAGLSLARLANQLDKNGKIGIMLRLDSLGLNFCVFRNNNLYFNHFIAWQKDKISFENLKDIVIRETQKVLNFIASHWSTRADNFWFSVSDPILEKKISQIINENFGIEIKKMPVLEKFPSLPSKFFIAFGSAQRGLISRSQDIISSLMGLGTEEEFREHQIIMFVKIWRNIFLVTTTFFLIVFGGIDLFLVKNGKSLQAQSINFSQTSEAKEVVLMSNEIKTFNDKVDAALALKKQKISWSDFLTKIKDLAGPDVIFKRIYVQSLETPVSISGAAGGENTLLEFKKRMEEDGSFESVSLPLSGLITTNNGSVEFNMTFKIKKDAFR